MKLDRATVCLPIADRSVSHTFYTALGFSAFGDPADDGLPEPLQFQISGGLRLMLIPRGGFGWMIGGRKRSPKGTHECQFLIALADSGRGRRPAASSSRGRSSHGLRGRGTAVGLRRRVRRSRRAPVAGDASPTDS